MARLRAYRLAVGIGFAVYAATPCGSIYGQGQPRPDLIDQTIMLVNNFR